FRPVFSSDMPWKRKNSIEDRLRAERPQAPEQFVRAVMRDLGSASPRRHPVRVAAVFAAGALGLLAIGGLGYAATYAGQVISVITGSKTIFSTHRVGVPLNAARAQYGT